MDEALFWRIIEDAARTADGDCEGLVDSVRERLKALPPDDIRSFDRILGKKVGDAYTWKLWGAAYLINGGCSDDGFAYFRAWLLTLGEDVYESAVADPDSLVGAVDPESDEHECEPLLYAASEAYEELTGEKMPWGQESYPTEPLGEQWDFDDSAENRKRLPRLSDLY